MWDACATALVNISWERVLFSCWQVRSPGLDQKPYVLGSLAMFWGWLHSAITRKPRYEDPEFRRFLRRYQWRAVLIGKEHAIEELYASYCGRKEQRKQMPR